MLKYPPCCLTGKHKPPAGEGFAENRTFSYQQIHAKISSNSKEAANYEFLSTDNWQPKASPEFPLYICRERSTNSLFYAKQTQFPSFLRQKRLFRRKTNPIQTQSNPIFRVFLLAYAAYPPQSNPTCSELVEPI